MRLIIIILVVWFCFGILVYFFDDNTNTNTVQEKNEFTVTFINDGKKIKEVIVKKGDVVSQPEKPEKDGYTFSHWATHQTSVDGSEIFDFNKPITKSIDIFAHYSKNQINNTSTSTGVSNRYQQIYDEYSKRLIVAGPTSSITEMAEILNEGGTKMAQYMYSAKGIDGQYATYESWFNKLYDVYISNCR